MNWPEQERWRRLWQAIGARGDESAWYETLTRAYTEPHRHYHNQQHIAECLAEFDAARQHNCLWGAAVFVRVSHA